MQEGSYSEYTGRDIVKGDVRILKYYIIQDKSFKKKYGITDKLWIAQLFMIQRHEYNSNLTIKTIRKDKDIKFTTKLDDNYIRYFSGFALTNREIQYIQYEMSMYYNKKELKKLKKKYNIKSVKKFLDTYTNEFIDVFMLDLIENCLRFSSLVTSSYDESQFFENLKDEMRL